jgi:hypothetical protein
LPLFVISPVRSAVKVAVPAGWVKVTANSKLLPVKSFVPLPRENEPKDRLFEEVEKLVPLKVKVLLPLLPVSVVGEVPGEQPSPKQPAVDPANITTAFAGADESARANVSALTACIIFIEKPLLRKLTL